MWHFNPDKEWEKFGNEDPFYAVLVNDKFRKDQITKTQIEEFYQSGSDHINFILETINKNLDNNYTPSRSLDFGCGVGRCTYPLAEIANYSVGTDVSEPMLNVAIQRNKNLALNNIEFVKSDDTLSKINGKFDFIHSFSTFQHIPKKRGYKIFIRLIELLSENGIGAIEFVYHREISTTLKMLGRLRKNIPLVHNFSNLLFKRPFSEPLMEKNVYNLKQLLLILYKNGCGNLHIKFFNNNDLHNVFLFFKKRKDTVPFLKILNGISLVLFMFNSFLLDFLALT